MKEKKYSMSNKLFNLNISDELREKIRKEAYENKTTLSNAARNILEEYFKQKEDEEQGTN
jgi:hypothetical protein